jgi:hypothetical protein
MNCRDKAYFSVSNGTTRNDKHALFKQTVSSNAHNKHLSVTQNCKANKNNA